MFSKKSRYHQHATIETVDEQGRSVQAIKLRRLATSSGTPHTVKSGQQLDVMAKNNYADSAGFWCIADANSELRANDLLDEAGRVIDLPKS